MKNKDDDYEVEVLTPSERLERLAKKIKEDSNPVTKSPPGQQRGKRLDP